MANKGYLIKINRNGDSVSVRSMVTNMGEEFGLKEMYSRIKCRHLDAVRLPENIDIWVDDEGLLQSGNVILEYLIKTPQGDEVDIQLAGNALFLSCDDDGNSIGLSREQFNWIKENITYKAYGEVR